MEVSQAAAAEVTTMGERINFASTTMWSKHEVAGSQLHSNLFNCELEEHASLIHGFSQSVVYASRELAVWQMMCTAQYASR